VVFSFREILPHWSYYQRLKTYKEQSVPVIEYFHQAGKVKTVDSNKSIEEVYEESCHILSNNGFQMLELWEEKKESEMMEKVILFFPFSLFLFFVLLSFFLFFFSFLLFPSFSLISFIPSAFSIYRWEKTEKRLHLARASKHCWNPQRWQTSVIGWGHLSYGFTFFPLFPSSTFANLLFSSLTSKRTLGGARKTLYHLIQSFQNIWASKPWP